jgi:hypothetical protein
MKHTAITCLLIATLFSATAHASTLQCGLRPLTPLGCTTDSAACVCFPGGECTWIFTQCR